MGCEINENENVSCIECIPFKTSIDVTKIVEKIAQILQKRVRVRYVGNGVYLLGDEVEVKCEWKEWSETSFSDYCIRCYTI